MKKIVSLLLISIMLFSLGSVAFAENLTLVDSVSMDNVTCRKYISSTGETVWHVSVPAYSQLLIVRGNDPLLEQYLASCKEYKTAFLNYFKSDIKNSVQTNVWQTQLQVTRDFVKRGEIYALVNPIYVLNESAIRLGQTGTVGALSPAGVAIQDLAVKGGNVLINFEYIVQAYKDPSFVFHDSYN